MTKMYRPFSMGSPKKFKPLELKYYSSDKDRNRSLIMGFSEKTQTRFSIKKKEQ